MNKLKLKQTIKEEIYKVLNEGIFSKKEYPLYTIEDSNDNFFQYVKNEHELGTNIDYITINNIEFTYENATEGEYVQYEINLTNNHPSKNINTRQRFSLYSNWNITDSTSRLIQTKPFLEEEFTNGEHFYYEEEGIFPAGFTAISYSPRFKIPYGLIDQDLYDVIA